MGIQIPGGRRVFALRWLSSTTLLICATGWCGLWYLESQSLRQCDLSAPSVSSFTPVTVLIRTRGYKHLTVAVVESFIVEDGFGMKQQKNQVRFVDFGEGNGPTGGTGSAIASFFRKKTKTTPDDP